MLVNFDELLVQVEEVVQAEGAGLCARRIGELQRCVLARDECVQRGDSLEGEVGGDSPIDGGGVGLPANAAALQNLGVVFALVVRLEGEHEVAGTKVEGCLTVVAGDAEDGHRRLAR
jgi:hypothetical protein